MARLRDAGAGWKAGKVKEKSNAGCGDRSIDSYLTIYERSRYNRLLKATAHLAPYQTFRGNSRRLLDSIAVIRAYARGQDLLGLEWDAIRRLIGDTCGQHCKPR